MLTAWVADVEALRRKVVATKEGGAITGEERLREFTDQLYGAINGYEGAPAAYQITRIGVLDGQLADISSRFDKLVAGDLAARNADLTARKLLTIDLPAGGQGAPGRGGGKPSEMLAGFRFELHPTQVRAAELDKRD